MRLSIFILLLVSCVFSSYGFEESREFDSDRRFLKNTSHDIDQVTGPFNALNNGSLTSLLSQELQEIIDAFINMNPLTNNLSLTQCEEDVVQLLLAIIRRDSWALHLLDSLGKPGSGIFAGNLRWPGSFSGCNSIVVNDPINFTGKYCWLSAVVNQSLVPDMTFVPPLSTALCIPATCSENSTFHLFQSIFKLFSKYLKLDAVTCVKEKVGDIGSDPKAITSLVIISIFLTVILIGTVTDLAHRRWARNCTPVNDNSLNEDTNVGVNLSSCSDEKIYTNSVNNEITVHSNHSSQVDLLPNSEKEEQQQIYISTRKAWLSEFLESFSLYTNGLKLFGMTQEKGMLSCLHGIRFLSMCWVVLGHTVLLAASFLQNPGDALPVLRAFYFQPILQAPFAVDSFFILSGLLVTYLYLKEYSKNGPFSKMKWLKFYIHRYLRLTPLYMIVLFVFWDGLFKYYSNGPFWRSTGIDGDNCSKNWWKNLLYINNFQNVSNMCMTHSWYLADDMQFFIISPLFLFFLTRSVPVAAGIGSLFILGSWITTGVLSVQNNITAVVEFQNLAANGLADPTIGFDVIYDKPYCRIPAYLIGMGCGWLLHKTKCRVNLHWVVSLLGWSISIICITTPIFGLYKTHPSLQISALYKSVTRSIWSLGLSWIIFACCTGYGGIVNRILSWPVWIPFSRLTYCVYLIHLIVMNAVYLSMESLRFFSVTNMIYDFFAHLVFSNMVSVAVSLMFEAPLLSLEKKMFERKR